MVKWSSLFISSPPPFHTYALIIYTVAGSVMSTKRKEIKILHSQKHLGEKGKQMNVCVYAFGHRSTSILRVMDARSGKEMGSSTVDKMSSCSVALITMLLITGACWGSHLLASAVWAVRGWEGSRWCWEWPVPDGDGEVPWGALAGPDDEETNLLAHK